MANWSFFNQRSEEPDSFAPSLCAAHTTQWKMVKYLFPLLNAEENAPGCSALLQDSTFSESFPSGVKNASSTNMTKIQDRRDRPSLVLARALSGIAAILRVIDDGDGRRHTVFVHCSSAEEQDRISHRFTVHVIMDPTIPIPRYSAPNHRRSGIHTQRERDATDTAVCKCEQSSLIKARTILFPNCKAHFPKEKSTNRE